MDVPKEERKKRSKTSRRYGERRRLEPWPLDEDDSDFELLTLVKARVMSTETQLTTV